MRLGLREPGLDRILDASTRVRHPRDNASGATITSDIAIIVRLCYAPGVDEEARAWRFELFREEVLPRLFAQDTPSDVWVWVHPRHEAEVRAMDSRIQTFTVDLDHRSIRFDNTTLRGFPWAAVRDLPRYRYQVLMGSDDLLGPAFVSTGLATLQRTRHPKALATFQPMLLHRTSGKLFQMKSWERPGPFVMLKQNVDDPVYTWVWAEDHRKLGKLVNRVYHVGEGQAVMYVHDFNDGTGLSGATQEVPKASVPWL